MNKKLYSIWQGMKRRCSDPNSKAANYYNKKGITVWRKWLIYENFEKWALCNGYEEGLSIDRIDNSLGYFPQNCRWITRAENSRKAREENRGIWNLIKIRKDHPFKKYDKALLFYGHKIAAGVSWKNANETRKEIEKDPDYEYLIINNYGERRKYKN